MALSHSPSIVLSGLTMCVDPANSKSYNSSENLVTYSEQFDHANWTKSLASVTPNADISPIGTNTADYVVTSGASNSLTQTYTVAVSVGDVYTASAWVKASGTDIGKTVRVGVRRGGAGTLEQNATEVVLTGSWQRVSASRTFANIQTAVILDIRNDFTSGTPATNFYVWGAQLERGTNTPHDYTVTTSSIVTRSVAVSDIGPNRVSATMINGVGHIPTNQGAFVFDATDDMIGNFTAPIGTQTGSRSICFVYKTNAITRICPISMRDSFGWFVCLNREGAGSISYNHASVGGNESVGANPGLGTNTWYHVGVTYDSPANTCTIYVNGTSIVSSNNMTPMATPAVNGTIGYELNSGFFNGQIGQTLVYDRALGALEIKQNFNAVRGRYGI